MNKTVAVIDDDEGLRDSVEHLLSLCGYRTECFGSAEEFLSSAAASKAACLVVDIQLGDISGLELARQLVADGYQYPIIFMTGLNDESIRSQVEAVGGKAFLNKPFPAKMLLDAVKAAIR
jgi:FixJ family two-component response regulator